MSVILGAVFGILKAFVSQFMQYLVIKENNRLKLEIAKMELQKSEIESKKYIHKTDTDAGLEELQSGYEHDIAISQGGGFVAGLKSLFRPLMTLFVMGMFIIFMSEIFYLAVEDGGIYMAIKVISLPLFEFVVTSVVSYWFANRGFEKFMNDETYHDVLFPATGKKVDSGASRTFGNEKKIKVDYSKKPVKKYNFNLRKK